MESGEIEELNKKAELQEKEMCQGAISQRPSAILRAYLLNRV